MPADQPLEDEEPLELGDLPEPGWSYRDSNPEDDPDFYDCSPHEKALRVIEFCMGPRMTPYTRLQAAKLQLETEKKNPPKESALDGQIKELLERMETITK